MKKGRGAKKFVPRLFDFLDNLVLRELRIFNFVYSVVEKSLNTKALSEDTKGAKVHLEISNNLGSNTAAFSIA